MFSTVPFAGTDAAGRSEFPDLPAACGTAVHKSSSVAVASTTLSSSEQSLHASGCDAPGKAQDEYGQHASTASRLASLDTGMAACVSGTAAAPLQAHRKSADSVAWALECERSDGAEAGEAPYLQPVEALLRPVPTHACMGSTDSSHVSNLFSMDMGPAVGTNMLCSADARPHIEQPHSASVQAMRPAHAESLDFKVPSEDEGEAEEDSDWSESAELTQDGAAETVISHVPSSPFQATLSASVAVGTQHSSCNGAPAGIDGPSGTPLLAFNPSLQMFRAGSPDTVGSVCQVGEQVPLKLCSIGMSLCMIRPAVAFGATLA